MKNQSHWVIKSLKYIKDRGRCSGHCLNLFGMNFVSFSASVVWLSGSQPGVCRSSRIREADDPEWSLESHHQSPQSSGSEPLTVVFKRSRNSCQNVPDRYWKSHFGLQDYINCAEIWVEFTCRHFTVSRKQSSYLFMFWKCTTFLNPLSAWLSETRGQHNFGWHHQTHDPWPSIRGRLPSGWCTMLPWISATLHPPLSFCSVLMVSCLFCV